MGSSTFFSFLALQPWLITLTNKINFKKINCPNYCFFLKTVLKTGCIFFTYYFVCTTNSTHKPWHLTRSLQKKFVRAIPFTVKHCKLLFIVHICQCNAQLRAKGRLRMWITRNYIKQLQSHNTVLWNTYSPLRRHLSKSRNLF